MKILCFNVSLVDYATLYDNRTRQYREARKLLAFFRKREKELMKEVGELNKLVEKIRKENGCLKALVDTLKEDELAIRCTTLEDECKQLKERLEKYDEANDKRRTKRAEQARRYRASKKRAKSDPTIVDLDVVLCDARQLGYDLEMRKREDGNITFHLVSRENGADAYSAATMEHIAFIIEKRKKEIYGED